MEYKDLETLMEIDGYIRDKALVDLEELTKQRDALLEALESMLNIFDRDLPNPSIGRRVCDEAHAAIAAAKGE